ncbi:ribonuclease P protein component [Candidatus Kaiserbacteria bacterium RIFOXYD1_FULL_42_15]|uniref:Ribonuclease P protein component n=1 Tax=Candidatus Kaiserbacteria bacterium RIFOXYD1_FULL_42_15 TaxID=1798532 RepID=A0A1F6FSS9_9BACT|nr:MAG: ribonuclease P protein component [Candidatus Kaiserbacteria bacterium RIFOXYD1_FULL_42_15]
MFKKSQRLSRPQFTTFFKQGVRFQAPELTLIYNANTPLSVSVVVGKKVFKNAVDRNRLRRRIYAGCKRYFDANKVVLGSYIIITKPLAIRLTRLATITATEQILARIGNSR